MEFLSDICFKTGTNNIQNPANPERSLYFVADFPHMLKLLRNHMFEKGFWFPKNPFEKLYGKPSRESFHALKTSGEWFPLNKTHFTRILDADRGEFKIHHKLQPLHVNLEAGAKTNVRIAAQTFSASSAAALRYLHLKPQADVVEAVNNVSKK